jgi:2-polyprenyl-6-methoxyphenol hydroxylase-like FAD-dependent oxidoreductase
VTVLGDAIHPMPPTAGVGASTAVIDAVHLADDLARKPLRPALAGYQTRLLSYAPAAVDEARPPLAWQRRLANPVLRALGTEVVLPLVNLALRGGPARP